MISCNYVYYLFTYVLSACMLSHSVLSDSLWPHGLQPTQLLCLWGLSGQEYWSRLQSTPPGDLPNPGIKLTSASPALTGRFFTSEPSGKPCTYYIMLNEKKKKKEKPTFQNYIFTMGDYNTQKINKNLCLIRKQFFFFSSFCIFAFYVVMILIL